MTTITIHIVAVGLNKASLVSWRTLLATMSTPEITDAMISLRLHDIRTFVGSRSILAGVCENYEKYVFIFINYSVVPVIAIKVTRQVNN